MYPTPAAAAKTALRDRIARRMYDANRSPYVPDALHEDGWTGDRERYLRLADAAVDEMDALLDAANVRAAITA